MEAHFLRLAHHSFAVAVLTLLVDDLAFALTCGAHGLALLHTEEGSAADE